MTDTFPEQGAEVFRLGYVPGATPARWVRTWRERVPVPLELVPLTAADAEAALLADTCDAAILRPPVDRELLHAIPLYEERLVVLVSRDHVLAALDETEEVALVDLDDELLLRPVDDVLSWEEMAVPGRPAAERPATTEDAVALVAAGVGVIVVPQSLARLHHRKDVTYRSLAETPAVPVSLAWVADRAGALTEEFIGIVRGRTANSSRGVAQDAPEKQSAAPGQAAAKKTVSPKKQAAAKASARSGKEARIRARGAARTRSGRRGSR